MSKERSAVYIGVDLGGTSIKGGVVTPEGSVIAERTKSTPAQEGREGILRELAALIEELKQASGEQAVAIGIGSAGRIDPIEGSVRYASDILPGWTGTPLREVVESRFGIPVFVDNDVNAAAVGESWRGRDVIDPTDSSATSVFVALGTGVGGAVLYRGKLMHGANGAAGEVGHMLLKPGGHPCTCGQAGCLEQYVSGTALNRIAADIDRTWNSRVLLQKCADGDPQAVAAIRSFAFDLAVGLLNIRNVLDPDTFILGGGLADSREVWWGYLTESLALLSPHGIRVERARLGNRAGFIGAAKLAMDGVSAAQP